MDNTKDKNSVYVTFEWLNYDTHKPNDNRFVIVAKVNSNSIVYDVQYIEYNNIVKDDNSTVFWIDIPVLPF